MLKVASSVFRNRWNKQRKILFLKHTLVGLRHQRLFVFLYQYCVLKICDESLNRTFFCSNLAVQFQCSDLWSEMCSPIWPKKTRRKEVFPSTAKLASLLIGFSKLNACPSNRLLHTLTRTHTHTHTRTNTHTRTHADTHSF